MPKYTYNKPNIIMGSIFAIVGLLIAFLAVTQAISYYQFNNNSTETTAVISDVERVVNFHTDNSTGKSHKIRTTDSYKLHIDYTVDGAEYKDVLLPYYYSTPMSKGDTITIRYNPKNPMELDNDGFIFFLFCVPFALMFLLIAFVFFYAEFRKAKARKRLIDCNKFLLAYDYKEVKANLTVRNVRYNMLVILCQDENGTEYKFKSQPFHPDKSPFVPDMPIKVYIDTKDPKNYYITQ